MVLFFEILLVLAIIVVTAMAIYIVYRLVNDES